MQCDARETLFIFSLSSPYIMHGNANEPKEITHYEVIQCMNKMMMLINMDHMLCRVI